jgi:hypothetical protein
MEGPHGGVAEQTDDPSYLAGCVVVIDLLGFSDAAHGAKPTLLPNELVDLGSADSVALLQMVVTLAPTVVASQGLTTLS